jgi:hypothetical protein
MRKTMHRHGSKTKINHRKKSANRGRLTPGGLQPEYPERGAMRERSARQHGTRAATREGSSNRALGQHQTRLHQCQGTATSPKGHSWREPSTQQRKQSRDKPTGSHAGWIRAAAARQLLPHGQACARGVGATAPAKPTACQTRMQVQGNLNVPTNFPTIGPLKASVNAAISSTTKLCGKCQKGTSLLACMYLRAR